MDLHLAHQVLRDHPQCLTYKKKKDKTLHKINKANKSSIGPENRGKINSLKRKMHFVLIFS